MSLLESILNNSANVVSAEHNVNNIRVEVADVDAAIRSLSGGRAWDASEYGLTLEQVQAMFDEANTPEARERVMVNLRTRAIRRAQLDTSNGRVNAFFAGKPAWHGLGVVVDKAATSAEAIRFAGMNWNVQKIENQYTFNGTTYNCKDSFSLVRGDTGAKLGTVGRNYKVVQNVDAFDFLDSALSEVGASYESAGSLYGGEKVWILARLPKSSFTLQGDDRTESYAAFYNPHDGSGAAYCYPTTVRIECANTLRIANSQRDGVLRLRHTGNLKAKIEAAKLALGVAVRSIETYKENAAAMVSAKVQIGEFANSVLDQICEVTEEQAKTGAGALAAAMHLAENDRFAAQREIEKQIAKRENMLEDILTRYESDRCRPNDSLWAAFNAVTEHADHAKPAKQSKDLQIRASRRFESVMDGDADEIKQIAYQTALSIL